MSNDQTTAGPWDAKPNNTGSCFIVRSANQVKVGGGHICQVDMWSHGDRSCPDKLEAAANAKLIAAAPDLLAALEEVVRITDRKHDAWDRARDAISKATGQSA